MAYSKGYDETIHGIIMNDLRSWFFVICHDIIRIPIDNMHFTIKIVNNRLYTNINNISKMVENSDPSCK